MAAPIPLPLRYREPEALALVGAGAHVPCADGWPRPYVNLDSAASTPALRVVADAVDALLPYYSSVHRGTGFKSQVATAAFEGARAAVTDFVGARSGDTAIFVRCTTEAINVLANALPADAGVLSSAAEHHANMLPWRSRHVELLPITASPDELLEATARALRAAGGRIALLAVTGASNVTGDVWPVAELAAVAHAHGAEILVDAAQLAPHRRLEIEAWDVDYVAISGHKLYAPYGAGALVGRPHRLAAAEPLIRGGGAVGFVTPDDVTWAGLPERHEAGSPNVLGAVALGVACDALSAYGMEHVAAHERVLARRLWDGLVEIDGIRHLRLWDEHACDRLGVATFVSDAYSDRLLAAILSAEHAIGVRNGCFCAHPLVTHLLNIGAAEAEQIRAEVAAGDQRRMPGAVRASIGLETTPADVDRLLAALVELHADGPRQRYVYDPAREDWLPSPDPRRRPALPFRLA